MRKFKFSKETLKVICTGTLLACVMFSNSIVYGAEELKVETMQTQDFIEWQKLSDEEKSKVLMPPMNVRGISEAALKEYSTNNISIKNQIFNRENNFVTSLVGATYTSASYNLNTDVKVNVKHQGITNECWAFSVTTALETNLAKIKRINKVFSPRHMDYSTSLTFRDGTNPYGFGREVEEGGIATFGMAYLTNGKGAVLESDMPFENNEERIYLNEINNKKVDTIVTDSNDLPTIFKVYTPGIEKPTYTNGASTNPYVYNDNDVKAIRNMIKDHVVKYGAIAAVTAGNATQYYNNPSDITKATAYFCNDSSIDRDHAITIVGWDDNYSKDNFRGAAKPYTNGAYICLNTYGEGNFNRGYLYISYEDVLIETDLIGIVNTASVDYDKIYQYNPMGSNLSLTLTNADSGYIANIYNRDSSKNETLDYVSVTIPVDSSLEIYVNPNGNSTLIDNMLKVAQTGVLKAGYHRIEIDKIKLNSTNFVVAIKQTSDAGFSFSLETPVKNTYYSTITGNANKCKYSKDGYSWKSISAESISGYDMKNTDLTIKAFTTIEEQNNTEEPSGGNPSGGDNNNPSGNNPSGGGTDNPSENNPSGGDTDNPSGDNPSGGDNNNPSGNPSEGDEKITLALKNYKIMSKTDIYNIAHSTKVKDFKKNLTTNSKTIVVTDSDGNEIGENDIIKNGMKMTLSDGSTYTLIVRGDTNCSGTITLTDFSKFIAHYCNSGAKYKLTGVALKACDLNCDGEISLIDLSQLIVLCNSVDY